MFGLPSIKFNLGRKLLEADSGALNTNLDLIKPPVHETSPNIIIPEHEHDINKESSPTKLKTPRSQSPVYKNQPEHTEDRKVLVELFHSTNGETWTKKMNWNTNRHINTWYGITLNEEGRVVRLEHSLNNLTAKIPIVIEQLHKLEVLDIRLNKLYDGIPSTIGNLSELSVFKADYNELSGSIPEAIGKLVHLHELHLPNNKLSDSIPLSIGTLVHLREFILSNNKLSGKIPLNIGNLVSLEKLYLNGNMLQGTLPVSLTQLVHLKEINCSENNLSGSLFTNWSSFGSLEKISLSNNKLSGTIPISLFDLPNIKEIELKNNKFSGTLPDYTSMVSLSLLEHLDVSKNSLSGILPSLSSLNNLKILNLSDNEFISHNIEECLDSLISLRIVDLSHNKISGYLPSRLFTTTNNMKQLNLHNNMFLGTIPETIGKSTQLEIINLANNKLRLSLPHSIYKLTKLITLDVSNNFLSGRIPESIFELPALKSFNISYNTYPIPNLRDYLDGNRFDREEKIILSREFSCIHTHLNSIESVIKIARMLNTNLDSSTNNSINNNSANNTSSNVVGTTTLHGSSNVSDLKVLLLLIINHEKLVTHAICNVNHIKSSKGNHYQIKSSKKWTSNPSYIIKLIKQPFYDMFQSLIHTNSQSLLGPLILLKIYNVITYASSHDPSSEKEFCDYAIGLGEALCSIFSLSAFDDQMLLYQVLLPSYDPNKLSKIINSQDGNKVFELLSNESIIGISLERNLKPIFSSPNISMIIREIFYTPSRVRPLPLPDELPPALLDDSNMTKYQRKLSYLSKAFQNSRYCPIIMFYLNCSMNIGMLYLTASVLANDPNYISSDNLLKYQVYSLVIMCISTILYEIGQYCETQSFSEYSSSVWNKFDLINCIALLIWVFYYETGQYNYNTLGMVSLAISAIPQSVSLLQYLCIHKEFGQLVIMILAMSRNIFYFLVVFVFCILGFGIFFHGLYANLPDSIYGTYFNTVLKMFSAALNNYDFSSFDGSGQLSYLGPLVMMVYVTFTSILLLNLLIARMSSAHNSIESRSQQEWSFVQASLLTEYAVMEKHNPLCILPAPLNLITFGIAFLDNFINSVYTFLSRRNIPTILPSPTSSKSYTIHNQQFYGIDFISTVANMITRIIFFIPIIITSYIQIYTSYKVVIDIEEFHYELSPTIFGNISIYPVFRCYKYLGFTDNTGKFHGQKLEDNIRGNIIEFGKSEKLQYDIYRLILNHTKSQGTHPGTSGKYSASHSASHSPKHIDKSPSHHDLSKANMSKITATLTGGSNKLSGNISKHNLEKFISSTVFSSSTRHQENIKDKFDQRYRIQKLFGPIRCIGIVLYEYIYCFLSDTLVINPSSKTVLDSNNGHININNIEMTPNHISSKDFFRKSTIVPISEMSLKSIQLSKGDSRSSVDEVPTDEVIKLYEEDEAIDLLRLLNLRSETIDRIETVKLHVKRLQAEVDFVKSRLDELKVKMDSNNKTQLDAMTDIFEKNMDELRYMIHK